MKPRIITLVAILLACSYFTVMAQTETVETLRTDNTATPGTADTVALSKENGEAAGAALAKLYSQFKSDGKLDMTNPANITNTVTLASNVKDLAKTKDVSSFVSGLISGSKNLINDSNVSSVLSALESISKLDLKSIGGGSVKAAASGLLSKLGAKTNTDASGDSVEASGILANLFGKLK